MNDAPPPPPPRAPHVAARSSHLSRTGLRRTPRTPRPPCAEVPSAATSRALAAPHRFSKQVFPVFFPEHPPPASSRRILADADAKSAAFFPVTRRVTRRWKPSTRRCKAVHILRVQREADPVPRTAQNCARTRHIPLSMRGSGVFCPHTCQKVEERRPPSRPLKSGLRAAWLRRASKAILPRNRNRNPIWVRPLRAPRRCSL